MEPADSRAQTTDTGIPVVAFNRQNLTARICGIRAESAGFTLIELLVVIAIIGILIGILLPAVTGMKTKAQIRQAETEVKNLAIAIRAYHTEYREWPVESAAGGTWRDDNDVVLRTLIASGNARARNFFETVEPVVALRDPFRSNLCYSVTISVTSNSVTVKSAGPDCAFATGDDISAKH
jgi:type II secretion system protein G